MRRSVFLDWTCVIVLGVSFAAPLAAQEKEAAKEEAKPAQEGAEKPAQEKPTGEKKPTLAQQGVKAKYDAMLADWKQRLKKLRDLRVEYATTVDKEKLIKIEETWRKSIDDIELMLPELIDTAEAAYKEAPNADPQLTTFLAKIIEDAYGRDDVEKVFQLGETLIANEADQKKLFEMTGYAAVCLNDYDKGKEYLEKAAKEGGLSPVTIDLLKNLETLRKNWEEEVAVRAKQSDDALPKEKWLPRVQLQTSKGEIILELFEDEAPETVGNFISLVESGFYKDVKFHRVLPHFMVQGGDPKGDGTGGPGYTIYCEVDKPGARKHFRGSLSMAKTAARDTGGSQFFMCLRPTPHLDGMHTVFGRVIKGFDVLSAIERTEPDSVEKKDDFKPGELTTLIEAKVMRKRDHEYKPNKVQ